MKKLSALLLILFAAAIVSAQNEITSITQKTFDYKDWVYKNVTTGKDMNLRKFTNGKKLVMVVYWAPWCHNWEYDVAYVQGLYEKYKDKGFDVIGVALYDPIEAMKAHIKRYNLTFPSVYETTSSADRLTSVHYAQRREAGDTRKWGSPWYVFLDPSIMEPEGQIVLSKKPYVVNGELKRDDTDNFIRQKLGLEALNGAAANLRSREIEVCEPETKAIEFKKTLLTEAGVENKKAKP